MRAIIVLGMMATANGDCTLDSSSAVAHGIQSALFVWAASKRCTGTVLKEAGVKCEQDVTAAIESVTAMANDIAGMVSDCNDKKKDKEDVQNQVCLSLVTDLVSKTAGLAKDGGAIADHCGQIVPKEFDHNVLGGATILGMCTVNSGAAINSLFKAKNVIQGAQKGCGPAESMHTSWVTELRKCATSSFNVLAVLSNLGAYLSASVAKCNKYDEIATHGTDGIEVNEVADTCASAVLASIADLSAVANIGMQLETKCHVSDARLFIENGSDEVAKRAGINPVVFGLAAILPITAVLSFVAGSRFAKARKQSRAFDPVTLESQQVLNDVE